MNYFRSWLLVLLFSVCLSSSVFAQSIRTVFPIWYDRDAWYEASDSDIEVVEGVRKLMLSYLAGDWSLSERDLLEQSKAIYSLLLKAKNKFSKWTRKHRIAWSLLRSFSSRSLEIYNLSPWNTYSLKYTSSSSKWEVILENRVAIFMNWISTNPYLFQKVHNDVTLALRGKNIGDIVQVVRPRSDNVTEDGYTIIPSDEYGDTLPVLWWNRPGITEWTVKEIYDDYILVDFPGFFGEEIIYTIEVLDIK